MAAACVAVLIQLAAVPKVPAKQELRLFCAVAMRPAIEKAAASYTSLTGTTVRIEYGSSGELEAKLKLDRDREDEPREEG